MIDAIPASQSLAARQETLLAEIEQQENLCADLRLDVEEGTKGADKRLEAARAQLRSMREELNEVDRAIPKAKAKEDAVRKKDAQRRGLVHAKAALASNLSRTDLAVQLSQTLERVAELVGALSGVSQRFWGDCRNAHQNGEILGINEFGATTPFVDPFPAAAFERAFVEVGFDWLGYGRGGWPFQRTRAEVAGDPKASLSLAELAKRVGEQNELIIRTAIEAMNEELGEE